MNSGTPHSEEAARLAALKATALLDSPAEEQFDRYTRLASKILDAPVSLISLVDENRQFFKSSVGLPDKLNVPRQTPLSHSFCKHVVDSREPLIINDARLHPILKDNPVVPIGVVAYLGFPLINSDGQVLGSFCAIDTNPREWTADQIESLRDLTASAMTEIELRRVNTELRRATIGKDQFVAMLSHDLRTPLSPALLTAAELAADQTLPERVREDLAMIHRNIELEVRMIDSLFDLTRILNGKLALSLEGTDLHAVLSSAQAMCRSDADCKQIDIQLELKAKRSFIQADPVKLLQVICNLLKNAIKFSHPRSEVMVRSADAGNDAVQFEVSDQGIGIPPEKLAHIFNAFEQGEASVTHRFGGLGLGLAICKGIVDAHGGIITASSGGPGKGATVRVVLQSATTQLQAALPPVLPVTELRRSLSILLVEDHEDSLRAMSRLLRKLDHRVATATTVSRALAAADTEDFDLLISDVGLPDGTGLQLMTQLLNRRPIKGIALTGYGMETDIEKSKTAGFQRHLTKPINFNDLQNAITEIS